MEYIVKLSQNEDDNFDDYEEFLGDGSLGWDHDYDYYNHYTYDEIFNTSSVSSNNVHIEVEDDKENDKPNDKDKENDFCRVAFTWLLVLRSSEKSTNTNT